MDKYCLTFIGNHFCIAVQFNRISIAISEGIACYRETFWMQFEYTNNRSALSLQWRNISWAQFRFISMATRFFKRLFILRTKKTPKPRVADPSWRESTGVRWFPLTIQLETPYTWWRHQMETFSALLALCAGNSPVTGEYPAQRPVTRSFDIFFDLRLNKRLSNQSWGWWFETPSHPL